MQEEVVRITDTPQTDALASVPTPEGCDFVNFHIQKYKEHARKLERENARVRETLREMVALCALGDVDETTEAFGWGACIAQAKALLGPNVK
jgi:hypothetical protein